MQSDISSATIINKFQQPMLFNAFKCEQSLDDLLNYKDLIQFTDDSGIYIIRLGKKHLSFLSANDEDSIKLSFEDIKINNLCFISAPSHTKKPLCFIAGSPSGEGISSEFANTIYEIAYPDEIIPIYKSSFFTIYSLHANDKFLFVGSDYNCLTRIDYLNNYNINNYYIYCLKYVRILSISSIDDYVCIVSSQSRLIIINQDTLKTLINIALPFPIHEDVQIKVGKVNKVYSAAILTNSVIHIVSFQINPSSYTYESSIPAQSLISYDFHDNSLVVLRESDCSFNSFSGQTTRISAYPNFSTDPQYEWDISKELEFIYTIDVRPSEKEKILYDKMIHFSYVFGYNSSNKKIDFSDLIQMASPRQMLSDPNGNLWITTENTLLYCAPITEEMASFRDLFSYKINYNQKCPNNSTTDEIINFLKTHMINLNVIKSIFPNFNDTDDITTFVNTNRDEVIKKLNSYLSNRTTFLSIPKKIYEKMTSYMHSEIDFTVIHDSDHTKDFITNISNKFFEDDEEYSNEIADMFLQSFKTIIRYVNNFSALLNNKIENNDFTNAQNDKDDNNDKDDKNDKDGKNDKNIKNDKNSKNYTDGKNDKNSKSDKDGKNVKSDKDIEFVDTKKFWNSIIMGQSYQQMKYFIALSIASNLFKKLKLDKNPQIHNKCIKLNDQIMELACSYASIYNISLTHRIDLELDSLDFKYANFDRNLSKQFSDLFDCHFLLSYINEIDDLIDSLNDSHKIKIAKLAQKTNNENKDKIKGIFKIIESLNEAENFEAKKEIISSIKNIIDEIKGEQPEEITELKEVVQKIIDFDIHQIFNYSSTMPNPTHLLVISMINLENGNTDAFFEYFRQFKFYDIKIPKIFYDFVIKKTKINDPETLVSFVNEEYENMMFNINSIPNDGDYKSDKNDKDDKDGKSDKNEYEKGSHFLPFFKSAIKIKDFDSAFNALMGYFSGKKGSAPEHARLLEFLIMSMKKNNAVGKFYDYPLGIHRLKILELLSHGSTTSLFLASALYSKCGEYSKSGSVLLKYVNSILAKTDPTEDELRKAKSALILISSLMKNHDLYIRNSATMCLIDSTSLKNFFSKIERAILEKKGSLLPRSSISSSAPPTPAPSPTPTPSASPARPIPGASQARLTPGVSPARIPSLSKNDNILSSSSSKSIISISKLLPVEAATLLNYTEIVNIKMLQEYAGYFLSRPNANQKLFQFIESIKNEEALQMLLTMIFDKNLRESKKIYGYWLQIVFAQHNMQLMNSLIQYFLVDERAKLSQRDAAIKNAQIQENSKLFNSKQLKFNFDTPTEKTINNKMRRFYNLSKAIIKEIISIQPKQLNQSFSILKIKPVFNFPLSVETTKKLLPLIRIYVFNSLKASTYYKYISSGYTFSIEEVEKSRIICCPRGKLSIHIKSDKEELTFKLDIQNKNREFDFIAIKYDKRPSTQANPEADASPSINIDIKGNDNNTEVVLVEEVLTKRHKIQ